MKSHGSIRVVRMWYDMRANPVLRCFINLEWPSSRDLLVGVVPELSS
jgi:hypothetical protein